MLRRRRGSTVVVATLLVVIGLSGCSGPATVHVTRDVTVPSGRGPQLSADVYTTATTSTTGTERRPAIVMIHGGAWTSGDKADLAGIARSFAGAGFVAVSVNYDLAGPDRYPHQVQDSQTWVRYVQQHAAELGVDPARVGVFGVSAGGNLALLVGTQGSGDSSLPPIRAVATWSGMSDLTVLAPPDGKPHPANPPAGCMGQSICIGISSPGSFTDFLGCTLRQCPQRFAAASPVNGVTAATPPMYLTSSQTDFAPFDQSQRMAAALTAKGVAAQAVAVPGAGHAETLKPQAMAPTIEFFRRRLA